MLVQQASPRVAHRYSPASECSTVNPASRTGAAGLRGGGRSGALLLFVRVVVEGRDHRGLHRRGHHHAGVLADRQQLGDQRGVAGDETGPVTGERRSSSTTSAPQAVPCGRRRRPRGAAPTPGSASQPRPR